MIRWIAAFIGFYAFRFPGAILGFFVGWFADQLYGNKRVSSGRSPFAQPLQQSDFELNLLALSATVIKSDGSVKSQELQFVRNYFIGQYGEQRAQDIFKVFNEEVKKEIQSIPSLASFFVRHTGYSTRLQILHFLFGVAHADGHVSHAQLGKISQIANAFRLFTSDFESIKAMFVKATDNAYKILEIEPSATDDEVKKAYRKMAKKYHPDKLQSQDPAMVKGAQEKFQEVQRAYESIQKERNI